MARKHTLLARTAGEAEPTQADTGARSEYTRRGASRSMLQSLDEMAETSMRMLEGETVVALDPALLEGSFVADRIGDDEEENALLREAIRQSGQSTPILVRPHPDVSGHFMIVFGHRRARAARELGIPVRAVVKLLEDIAHVIAQGQENSARTDLTFIEKALFAARLVGNGMGKDVAKAALSIDDTLLSRMLSVVETVPREVIEAVGAAKGVGRDRWEELKKLMQMPVQSERARAFVASPGFAEAAADHRFNLVLDELKTVRRPKKQENSPSVRRFDVAEKAVAVSTRDAGKTFTIALTAKDASDFGAFVSEQLEALYQAFQAHNRPSTGD